MEEVKRKGGSRVEDRRGGHRPQKTSLQKRKREREEKKGQKRREKEGWRGLDQC